MICGVKLPIYMYIHLLNSKAIATCIIHVKMKTYDKQDNICCPKYAHFTIFIRSSL